MDAANRSGGVCAIVEYDYASKEPDELDLVKGAVIHSIKQLSGGWWEGVLQATGKAGMFPDNFVRVIDANGDGGSSTNGGNGSDAGDSTVLLRDKSATLNRRCKVIYSYTQVNDDELSLAVGDVIEFLGEVEEGWWRGRLKTKVGVFPSNFVIAIEPSPIMASKRPRATRLLGGGGSGGPKGVGSPSHSTNVSSSSNNSSSATTTTTATHSSTATATTTTTTINNTAKKVQRLSFHSSKEDLLQEEVAPSLPPKPQRDFCRVEFPYAPQNDDELELKVGDVITVISMDLPDKGWWRGELRGKVGVFPDNFVKLMAPSEVTPLNEPQPQSHRTAKTGATTTQLTSSSSLTAAHSATTTTTTTATSSGAPSKVFIKKSGSSSSTQSSNRKDSFGSRDSLNDILSETGLPSGNVAAQRKSLENKNLDLLNAPDANARHGLKKTLTAAGTTTTTTSSSTVTSASMMSASSSSSSGATVSTSEMRKSSESLEERQKTTPPPVLTKKPSVPTKKSSSVTSVAGNIFSGLKQKVKNVESKLTTAASQDSADGIGGSRMSAGGGLPDAAPGGHLIMRRAATISGEDTDFDRVERASILTDMRAGRVRAPKRRPPSAAINAIGENNNTVYLNGSDAGAGDAEAPLENGKPPSSDEEQLAKPKPREWEKKKAPWMDELKASQVKKKTSPSVEPRTAGLGSVAERTSKLIATEDTKITTTHASSSVTSSTTATHSSSSSATAASSRVQSSSVSSTLMQQSQTVESSQRRDVTTGGLSAVEAMTRSMTATAATATTTTTGTASEDGRTRPNSLSLRNRSISPSLAATGGRAAAPKASAAPPTTAAADTTAAPKTAAATSSTTILNHNHHQHLNNASSVENNVGGSSKADGGGGRVVELERRVERLETVVHTQQRAIDELVRMLREETDRVKVLRGELDKYAQCVTQV